MPGYRRVIDLTHAATLRDVTVVALGNFPVGPLSILLHEVLPTLQDGAHLNSCTVVMTEPWSHDADVTSVKSEELAREWAEWFASGECPHFTDVHLPCDVLALRLPYPIRWDEHLYKGIETLRLAGIPLRLEYTTAEGFVNTYVPSED